MKLTWTTLMLVMMAPLVMIVLYLVIYNQPIESWSDLPVVVKVLLVPPMLGLAYLIVRTALDLVREKKNKRK